MPDLPPYVWKRRLDQIPDNPPEPSRPAFEDIVAMLPAVMRLRKHIKQAEKAGKQVVWNPFKPLQPGPTMGAPLGGFGGGSMSRGWRGDFNRFQMQPGHYVYKSVWANQFIAYVQRGSHKSVTQVLYPGDPGGDAFAGWDWSMPADAATYHALYPRAWTSYTAPDREIILTCRQISPIIPHNYKESSYPVGVFAWTLENSSQEDANVSLMLTLNNGLGTDNDRAGGHQNVAFRQENVVGVALKHRYRMITSDGTAFEDPLTFAIAGLETDKAKVTYFSRFSTSGSGMDVYGDFQNDGRLEDTSDERPSPANMGIGAGIAISTHIPAGESREIAFALAWDMPLARFGEGRAYYRRYTRFFGRDGDAAPKIAAEALNNYHDWEAQIEAWQQPIFDDPDLPDWYKAELFNQLYYLADGGTIWTDGEVREESQAEDGDTLAENSHFAYLESHEYRMYNTYDVHFYASFALAMLWPQLELSLQRDIARTLSASDDTLWNLLLENGKAQRKVAGAIPHDIGSPHEDPWYRLNAYQYRDVSRWKDLNPKFILQVYRDYVATGDEAFLREMWPTMVQALDYAMQFDIDGDGMIDNDGIPDQTYDTWVVSGPSAYSGGLWIAALLAIAATAVTLGETAQAEAYQSMAAKAQAVYQDELWNGTYFDYDVSSSRQSTSVMADQMAGQWYAKACGLENVVPDSQAKRALQKVFDFNVMQFEDGEIGAVNGMHIDGRVDTSSGQSQEVWTGTTFAVAAAMIQQGMVEEGFKTAQGIHDAIDEFGFWFAVPEAWLVTGEYRALSYMRPLAIWAMQWAWAHSKTE